GGFDSDVGRQGRPRLDVAHRGAQAFGDRPKPRARAGDRAHDRVSGDGVPAAADLLAADRAPAARVPAFGPALEPGPDPLDRPGSGATVRRGRSHAGRNLRTPIARLY